MTTENFYFLSSIQHTDSGVAAPNKVLQPAQKQRS